MCLPAVPFPDDNEPGIQLLFSGDPDTTEAGCSRDAPRAGTGGEGGKLHNDFLECDNWDFGTQLWGQNGFLQGEFVLGLSPFSTDGGWLCDGNEGPGGNNPCPNSTVRAVPTFKNQPAPMQTVGHPPDTARDWVFSVNFKIEVFPGDTFGNDTLLSITTATKVGQENVLLQVVGANANGGTFFEGQQHRYQLLHGPIVDDNFQLTIFDQQIIVGQMTVHYKAVNQRLDLWLNDQLLLADFESVTGFYDAVHFQVGGGSISFENALYDNMILGVLVDEGACGPQGPGASAPGDFNCDGIVDVADLGIVGANFNTNDVTYIEGDANLDNVVDVADLGILGANWTASQIIGNASALVPEPATLFLLVVSVLVVRRGRH